MEFAGSTLASGRTFRTLNIVDNASRECLAIEVDTSSGRCEGPADLGTSQRSKAMCGEVERPRSKTTDL